jgi:ABC-2 type transport system permease protein
MTNNAIVPVSDRKLKNHVGFKTTISNTFTFAYRALLKTFASEHDFMDITIMPVVFTLLFTFIFGGAVSGNIANYLPIVIPGVLIQTFLTSCSSAGTQLREDMDKSSTSRFKSMPISQIAPIAGVLTADFVRFAVAGIVVFATGYIIGYRPEAGLLAVVICILFLMLVAWCLSWLFALIGLIAKSASTASTLGFVIMLPLTFLSNAFVPTETMPGALRFFAEHINPLTKAVSAVRQMLTYGTVGTDFWFALLGALAIFVLFAPLTLRKYMRRA